MFLMEVIGEAPVPPSWPLMVMTSAPALATPVAIIPTPGAGHQLHADSRLRIDRPQVVDQLRQVLDAVDIMMRRRRNQHHPRHRMA